MNELTLFFAVVLRIDFLTFARNYVKNEFFCVMSNSSSRTMPEMFVNLHA